MIIVDTGFFFALANANDSYHERATRTLEAINEPLITTYPVVTETCYLLLATGGNAAQCRFLSNLCQGTFDVFSLQRQHVLRIVELMEKYADLPMDLADASLVVLAEHLKHGRILTVDRRDFNVYRWNNKYSFENLLHE
jgi:uncharacterized protein